MRPTLPLLLLLASLGLAACETPEQGTYPLSGQACTADDPVQDFGATDCSVVAGTGVGTM